MVTLNGMRDTLYIIGNGFDLHHKMKTSFMDFRSYVRKKQSFWKSLFTIYGNDLNKDMWWWNFEEMLGKIDYLNLMNSTNGRALGPSEIKNLLINEVPFFFGEWIQNVDDRVKSDESLGIDKTSLFFTFNYTLLLEKVYDVIKSNVWHIHKSINDIKHGDNPIVGHDSDEGQLVMYTQEYIKRQQKISSAFSDESNQALSYGAKKVYDRIKSRENEDKFNQYSDISHYVVMGFSFNDIDMPYIKKIIEVNKNISDADWTLYYYNDNEIEGMIQKILKYDIKREQILSPIKWRDII